MTKLKDQFDARIARLQIGEPIASVFRPRFHLQHDKSIGYAVGTLMISTLDSLDDATEIIVQFGEGLSEAKLASLVQSDETFFHWIRETLRRMLLHELDECLRVDGRLLNDPHK
jgi:hypothetical protein